MTTDIPTTDELRAAWDGVASGFDELVTPRNMPFGEHILRRLGLRPGTRFLDVACGTGALSIPAAHLGATVTGVDLSPAMIERLTARARRHTLRNVEGMVMDGNDLEFGDDTFDVSVSLNGVSLFPDLGRGLREIVRVTKPGGRVLIAAFGAPQQVEFLGFFLGAVQAAVPGFAPLPMDPPPLPFRLADPDVHRDSLAEAGLADVDVDTTTWSFDVESATDLWDLVRSSNPIGAQMVAALSAGQQAEALRVLDGMLRERSGGAQGATLTADVNVGVGVA